MFNINNIINLGTGSVLLQHNVGPSHQNQPNPNQNQPNLNQTQSNLNQSAASHQTQQQNLQHSQIQVSCNLHGLSFYESRSNKIKKTTVQKVLILNWV